MTESNPLKRLLGDLPLTAEVYWSLRAGRKPWSSHFNLEGLKPVFPTAVAEVKALRADKAQGKKVLLFATLHYWIAESSLIALALAGQGHQVSLGYLPYAEWDREINHFDLRQQDLYAGDILKPTREVMQIVPLLRQMDQNPDLSHFPEPLSRIVEHVSDYDTQYTLQSEKTDCNSSLYALRFHRNAQAAAALYEWFSREQPDIVIVPNGTILEMGVAYAVAEFLGIKTITFEFADQRERIWLAQDGEIMAHDTDDLWRALGGQPLPDKARRAMVDLFSARKNAKLWGNFARQWQQTPVQGASSVRLALNLDERPMALLATNVLGDSLTLGRQQISETMADWIVGTIRYFSSRNDFQLVIRVHPGELLTHGTSMTQVIRYTFPQLPENIHLLAADDKTNTYDLIETTDLGLVYTTTAGLEMAMTGLPVIVAGKTHYARKGFTLDPTSWEEYEQVLSRVMAEPHAFRLSEKQIEKAWLYAYLFFFEFSLPFPWHLVWLGEDFKEKPLSYVLSEEGQKRFGHTFSYLVGEPLNWAERGLARLQELPEMVEVAHD